MYLTFTLLSTEMLTAGVGQKRSLDEETTQEQVSRRQNTGFYARLRAQEQAEEAMIKTLDGAKTHEKERLKPLMAKVVQENASYAGCLLLFSDKENKYSELYEFMLNFVGLQFDVQEFGILNMSTLTFGVEDGKLCGSGSVRILNRNGVSDELQKMDLSSQIDKHFTLQQAEALKTNFANQSILVPIYYASVKRNGKWVIDTRNGVKKDFHLYFGGKNNANESPYETIVREFKEETGLDHTHFGVCWSKSRERKYWYKKGIDKSGIWNKPFAKVFHKSTTEMWRNGSRIQIPVKIVSTHLDLVCKSNSNPVTTRMQTEPGIFEPIS